MGSFLTWVNVPKPVPKSSRATLAAQGHEAAGECFTLVDVAHEGGLGDLEDEVGWVGPASSISFSISAKRSRV